MIEHSLENGKGTGTRLVVDNTNAPALTTQAKCIIQRGVRQTEFGCLPWHFNGVLMTGLGGTETAACGDDKYQKRGTKSIPTSLEYREGGIDLPRRRNCSPL